MLLQYGPDELDDCMAALANLKQTDTVSEYHKGFIKFAHLVDDFEKTMISLFLFGLREILRGKVKMDKPLTIVVAYRTACATEMIAITDKRLGEYQPYKSSSFPALRSPSSAKGLATDATGKEGSSET